MSIRADQTQAAPSTPPAPAPPAAPAVPGTIRIPSDKPGEELTVRWDKGTLTVVQGTSTMAIPFQELIPARAVDITIALCATLVALVLGAPLLRFWLRRVERRQAQQVLDAAVAARLDALERHIDTVAVEVERVSEGQRYFTKLLEAREGAATPSRPA